MKTTLYDTYSFCQQGERPYQEDARWPDKDVIDSRQNYFMVCDGVGGSAKGEVASSTVCQAMAKAMSNHFDGHHLPGGTLTEVLDHAFDALDHKASKTTSDMATTMTFVCFHDKGCTMAHIGDSRIYHIRPDVGIIFRSEDHSLVNNMVRQGLITPEEAINHPKSNVITRYMGPVAEDETRCAASVTTTDNIKPGDYFLLCTDGVLHCITDDELVQLLDTDGTNQQKMYTLARKCATSSDNNTATLIQVAEVSDKASADATSSSNSPNTRQANKPCYKTEDIQSIKVQSGGWIKSILRKFKK